MADEVEVNGIRWRCEVAEPRYGNVRPCWSATIGPATILAREYRASGLAPWWAVRLDCGEERRDEGEVVRSRDASGIAARAVLGDRAGCASRSLEHDGAKRSHWRRHPDRFDRVGDEFYAAKLGKSVSAKPIPASIAVTVRVSSS